MERLTEKGKRGAWPKKGWTYETVTECLDRLADIEDILGDDYDLDRLRELVEADRDGRCVVLPCKIGDTLYRIQRFKRGKNWRKEAEYIRTVELNKNNLWRVVFEGELGETVFLTREAAQAALAREKVCHNCKEGWAKPSTLEKPSERCSDTCERYKATLKGDHHENL